ncbi:MAG: hypothetical protein AB7P50_18510 [Alphaproteobacteria bacterium]
MIRKFVIYPLLALCLFACAAVAWLLASNAGLAFLLVEDVAKNGQSSLLSSWRPEPNRQTILLPVGTRRVTVDVFVPASSGRTAIVLVPGLSPQGKDDPRLGTYARSLARAGFRVFVPDIESFRELRIGPDDADQVADLVAKLLENKDKLGFQTLGLQAVSYAVGPTVIAATRVDIRDRIKFIVGIGGYYETVGMIRYFTTGKHREMDGQAWLTGLPDPRAKWVFAQTNATYLADPRQSAALQAIALIKRDNLPDSTDRWEADLGPEGDAILRLMLNTDPDRVAAYLAALPANMRGALTALDLSGRDLATQLKARLILIHGSDDPVIPSSESKKLVRSVRNGDLYLVDNLFHADLGEISFRDGVQLWLSARAVLDQIDE